MKPISTYNSLSKSEQAIVDEIARPWVVDKETVADLFVTYEKNISATRGAVGKWAFNRTNLYKR